MKRYVQEKAAYVQARTSDEHILVIPSDRDSVTIEGRARIYTIKSPLVSRTSRYRILLRLERVEQILCDERPDIIESGDPYQVAWKAIASGHALRIPVIGFYHSHFPEAYLRSTAKYLGALATEFVMDAARRYVRSLYNRFQRTLVPSPALATVLADWGVTSVENIDLGVNTNFFRPDPDDAAATRAELGLPADQNVLLYIGRLAHEKNTQTLFAAFRLLQRNFPGRYHLLVVGDGLQRRELQSLIAEHPSQITHLPYCGDSAQLARLYRAADLFVHPGIQETFGLVSLESQACGTPVIGIRGSYMDRIIHTDQTLWAAANTPAALAGAIAESSLHPTRTGRAELGALVMQRYSWSKVFDRLFDVYRTVVKEYPTSR